MMFGTLRALKTTRLTPRQHALTQKFNIASKSAQGRIGLAEGIFVMAFLFVAVLGPAGWILSNSCERQKKRP